MRGSNQGERDGNRSAQQGYRDSPATGRGRGGAGGRSHGTAAAGFPASPAAGTGRGGSYNAVPPPVALMGSGSSGARASGSRDAGSGHRSGLGYSESGRGYHGSASYGANDGHNNYAAGSPGGASAVGGGSSSRGYSGGAYGGSPPGAAGSSYGTTGRGGSYGSRAHDTQGSSYGSSPSGRGGRRALPNEQGGGAYSPLGKPHFCIAEGDWGVLSVRADPKTQSIFELGVVPGERFSRRWLAAVSTWTENMARKHPNFSRQQREAAAASAMDAASMLWGRSNASGVSNTVPSATEEDRSDAGSSVGDSALDMVSFLQQQAQQADSEQPKQDTQGLPAQGQQQVEAMQQGALHEPDGTSDHQADQNETGTLEERMETAASPQRPAAAAAADKVEAVQELEAGPAPAAPLDTSTEAAGDGAAPAAAPSATADLAAASEAPAHAATAADTTNTADADGNATAASISEPAVYGEPAEILQPLAEALEPAGESSGDPVQAAEAPAAGQVTNETHDEHDVAAQGAAATTAAPDAAVDTEKAITEEVKGELQTSEQQEIVEPTAQHEAGPGQQAQQAVAAAEDETAESEQQGQQKDSVQEVVKTPAAAANGAEADEQLLDEQIVLPVTGGHRHAGNQQVQQQQQQQQQQQEEKVSGDNNLAHMPTHGSTLEAEFAALDASAAPGMPHASLPDDRRSDSATSSSARKAQPAAASPAAGSVSTAAAAAAAAATKARLAALADQARERGDEKRHEWRCRVSLRLERQALTDEEMQLLADWHAVIAPALDICKLWLYDNRIGDTGARAVARIMAAAPTLAELHLSHNQIGTAGAKALLGAVAPEARPPWLKPLWLRLEYNEVDADALKQYAQEDCALRGLLVDIATAVPADRRHGHEKNMKWNMKHGVAHVQLPWLDCQRQAPAEAKVLLEARQAWARTAAAASAAGAAGQAAGEGSAGGSAAQEAAQETAQRQALPPPPIPAAGAAAAPEAEDKPDEMVSKLAAWSSRPSGKRQARQLPGTRGPRSSASPAAAAQLGGSSVAASDAGSGSVAKESQEAVEYVPGPLLLFPDTSAVLSMLGANGLQGRTVLSMGVLQSLAENGRFGRGLAPEQQTFIVLSDAVMKQLDSLKNEEGPGRLVRRLMGEGLDQLGPKGLDIVTVLGAHEGEGLVLDRNANMAGSRSTSSSGQRSDLSIVEVALFFKAELCAAAAAATSTVQGGGAGAGRQLLPVVLLTNDNGQLQVAKAHGLPAVRITGNAELDDALKAHLKQGGDLTSSDLRQMLGPAALAGLGAAAGRSVQDEFDGAVACLRGLLDAYEDMAGLVRKMGTMLSSISDDPQGIAAPLRALLANHSHATPFTPAAAPAPELIQGTSTASSSPDARAATSVEAASASSEDVSQTSMLSSSQATIAALQHKLKGWEHVVRSRQAPSRVAKWSNGV